MIHDYDRNANSVASAIAVAASTAQFQPRRTRYKARSDKWGTVRRKNVDAVVALFAPMGLCDVPALSPKEHGDSRSVD